MTNNPTGKTAFVFAGGGSFGAIQVGMLRGLVAYGLRPDFVVGSSVGAINSAYFAGDPTAAGVARLENIWTGLKRRDVFPVTLGHIAGFFSRTASLVDPNGLRQLIERHLSYRELDKAVIPVHIVATELMSGASVLLSSGSAVDAILASCAIPAVFPPILVDQRYLIDGAIASNTPIMTAVDLGATRLIVLPTGYACALAAPPTSVIANALHALNMLIAHQLIRDMEKLAGQVAVMTVPPLCPLAVSPYDFSRANELIERAAENTHRWLESGGMAHQGIPGALRPHVD